ncbi:MAG: hypothetical protein DHS20C13_30500 [Thermodesulfobacteriota bacterium]|nr:MAG: hypothetical protein DHS20C13_30500 [Thermodesulfobacteriota bacterium]
MDTTSSTFVGIIFWAFIIYLSYRFYKKYIRNNKEDLPHNSYAKSSNVSELKRATDKIDAEPLSANAAIDKAIEDLKKSGLSDSDIDFMSNHIKEYLENKFISKRDLSFVEYYQVQDAIMCLGGGGGAGKHYPGYGYGLFSNMDRFNDLSLEKIEFRCSLCNKNVELTVKDYQTWITHTNSLIFSQWNYWDEVQKLLKERYKDYLSDQRKLHGLFVKRGIQINYFRMIPLMNKIEKDVFKDFTYGSIINPAYEKIKPTLDTNADAMSVIKDYLRFCPELNMPTIISEKITQKYEVWMIKELLNKFGIHKTFEELPDLIDMAREQNSIESFEKTLGKEKVPIYYDYASLDGVEFEKYVRTVFENLSFHVDETRTTGDQGADLVLNKGAEKTVVQVKNHNKNIPNKAIQEVVAAKKYYDATNAMVVVSSSFTQGAIDLALKNGVELWDGQKLRNAVKEINDR